MYRINLRWKRFQGLWLWQTSERSLLFFCFVCAE